MRYAALAFVVLGALAAGAAIDWSAPSRAPISAIELHPGPPQVAARPEAPKVIQKAKHGGREIVRNTGAAPRSRSVGTTSSSVSTSSSVADASTSGNAPGTDADDGEDRQTVSRQPATPPREDDADEPAVTTTTAAPAPVPPPELAGDLADDDDEEDDDDDDGGEDDGGGDDDEDDG